MGDKVTDASMISLSLLEFLKIYIYIYNTSKLVKTHFIYIKHGS